MMTRSGKNSVSKITFTELMHFRRQIKETGRMENSVAENLFYMEQCKMLHYFSGKYQPELTNRSYSEFTNFTFLSEWELMSMSYRSFFMYSD